MWSVRSGSSFSSNARFHSLVSRDSKSATRRSCWSWGRTAPCGFMSDDVQIQLSVHTFVFSPLPMTLPRCWSRRSLPHRTPFQPCDEEETVEAFKKDTLWQYLPSRIREGRQSGLVIKRHAILSINAWLKSRTSRKPKPPRCLGNVSVSHATQQILFSPSLVSHQYLVNTDWIWLHRPMGSSSKTLQK